ncbi:hypothetical protein [Sulfurimonas sp.]|uniref:hypothetical protein n=1 Tax=Sulfurimonas sp. TaxID=2022749 RepID=UPI0025DCB992|nr:hypothetical protein [Sulfurimonas sp.]
MKALFITLLLLSFLQADEMQRIESIVEDITKLRADYEECQNTLKSKEILKADIIKIDGNDSKTLKYQKKLKTQRQQNIKLKAETQYLKEKLVKNKNTIIRYNKLLKLKDNEILTLKKKIKKSSKQSKKKKILAPVCVKPIDTNPFPKLMQKENIKDKEKIQRIKASTYCLHYDSSIYDSINGSKMSLWTKDTPFTSNIKTKNWVKITGFFINKKWKKAKKEMWIKNSQVTKR